MTVGVVSQRKASTSNVGYKQTVTTVAGLGDPAYDSVSLLLLANGVNGGTNSQFRDTSTNNLTITAVGNPTQGSFSPVGGGSSMYIEAAYLRPPYSTGFVWGTGDFTIECWVNKVALAAQVMVYDARTSATNLQPFLLVTTGNVVSWQHQGGVLITGTTVIAANTWYHIAVSRSSGITKLFINGVQDGSSYTDSLSYTCDASGPFIGATGYVFGYNQCASYFCDFRIVKGTALYTANFTPPTAPLTAVANTQLLLNFANANIVDSSTSKNTITVFGNTQTSTTQRKYGASSIYFDGTGDYLATTDTTVGNLGTSDFTVEFWMWSSGVPDGPIAVVGTQNSGSATPAGQWRVSCGLSTGRGLWFNYTSGGAFTDLQLHNSTITNSQWNHIAVTRQGTTVRGFVNGIQTGSGTVSVTLSANTPVWVGRQSSGILGEYAGYLDDLRITRGLARYTANFTPPQSELASFKPPVQESAVVAAYGDPYWDNTTLLLLGNGVNGGTNSQFRDSSANNVTVTPTGSPAQGSFAPITGASSALFNGNGDYLTAPISALGSGNWTVEFWVNFTSNSGTSKNVLDFRLASNGSFPAFSVNATMFPAIYNNSAFALTSSIAVTLNNWVHVAYVKNGSTTTVYVNGVSGGSFTDNNTYLTSAAVTIGNSGLTADARGFGFNGYVSGLRVITGTALYTANFTPPTTAPTAVAGTSLLLSFANGNIVDSSPAKNTVTLAGNTQTSVTQRKYGVTSMYFDGTGDNLTVPVSSGFDFGTGDFTIEGWLYPTANGPVISPNTPSGTLTTNISIFVTAGQLQVTVGNTGTQLAGGTVTMNAWIHFAVVRRGDLYTLYANGINVATHTASGVRALQNTGGIAIGYHNAVGYFTGYMDDIRITKGVARYVTNFQPPISELPSFSQPLTIDPLWSQTSLLLKGDGANNGNNNALLDSSANNLTITSVGNPVQGSFSPFTPIANSGVSYSPVSHDGSIYFDGTNYVNPPGGGGLAFGSSDFTIELWLNANTTGTVVLDFRPASTNGTFLVLGFTGAVLGVGANGGTLITGTTLAVSTWYHVAVSRASGTTRMFVNGVLSGSASDSIVYTCPASRPLVGGTGFGGSGSFNGYISNLRIVNGTALYTGNFTAPTRPLGASTILDGDPASKVSLLLNGNGVNGGTNSQFLDSSSSNLTVTAGGTPTQSTFGPLTGTTSAFFNGSTDFLTASGNDLLGTGDFTVEFWFYSTGGSTQRQLCSLGVATYATVYVALSASNTIGLTASNNNTSWGIDVAATPVTLNVWNHYVVCRTGSTWTTYLNGVQNVSATLTPAYIGNTNTIGANTGGSLHWQGFISNFRVIKGAALYSGNFTPPSSPVTAVAGTSLLLNFANGNIVDSSPARNTVSLFGNAQTSITQTKFGATSMYFDGTGDYLTIPSSTNMQIGAGDFTIECWLNTSVTTQQGANSRTVFANDSASSGVQLYLGIGTGVPVFGAGALTGTTNVANGAWHHIAIARSGPTARLFVNGVSEASATISTNFSGTNWIIGAVSAANGNFNGYIDDLRFTKGAARYTANFTPPTQQLSANDPIVTGKTELLLNARNANIYDSTMKNNLRTVGDSRSMVAVNKFGPASIFFDGTGDWLQVPPNVNLALATGDFTIEFWVYPSNVSSGPALFDIHDNNSTGKLYMTLTAGGNLFIGGQSGAPKLTTSGSTISNSVWHHVCLMRAGGTTRAFINGTLVGSFADSTNYTLTSTFFYIGSYSDGSGAFNGYIDDFRVTKGVSRYSSAGFAPPTQSSLDRF